jgi:hypothetical protein
VIVRVLDTKAIEINGRETDFRRFGSALLDKPPPSYTGDAREVVLQDDIYKSTLVIRQTAPFRAHILAVVRKLTANDT